MKEKVAIPKARSAWAGAVVVMVWCGMIISLLWMAAK